MERKKTREGQDICYCDKGIQPKDAPSTKYRCSKCGGIVWPKGMGEDRER